MPCAINLIPNRDVTLEVGDIFIPFHDTMDPLGCVEPGYLVICMTTEFMLILI